MCFINKEGRAGNTPGKDQQKRRRRSTIRGIKNEIVYILTNNADDTP